jgi:hypothetical protein
MIANTISCKTHSGIWDCYFIRTSANSIVASFCRAPSVKVALVRQVHNSHLRLPPTYVGATHGFLTLGLGYPVKGCLRCRVERAHHSASCNYPKAPGRVGGVKTFRPGCFLGLRAAAARSLGRDRRQRRLKAALILIEAMLCQAEAPAS